MIFADLTARRAGNFGMDGCKSAHFVEWTGAKNGPSWVSGQSKETVKMPLTYKMSRRVVQGSHCNPLCQHCAQVHNNSLPPPPQQFPAHCLCGCCASQLTSTHDTCPFVAPRPRNPSRICSSRYSSTVAPVPREDFPMALNGRPRKLY